MRVLLRPVLVPELGLVTVKPGRESMPVFHNTRVLVEPSIPTARKRMQINASKMKANAVLLHSCEVTSGTPGCYRQAVCIGSALNITAK